jgi:hypothetical protein
MKEDDDGIAGEKEEIIRHYWISWIDKRTRAQKGKNDFLASILNQEKSGA